MRLDASQGEVYRLRREKEELERRLNDAGSNGGDSAEVLAQLQALRSRVDFTDRLLVQQRQVNEKQATEVTGMRQQMAGMRDSLERTEAERQELSQQLDSLRGEYDTQLVAGQGEVFNASNWRAVIDSSTGNNSSGGDRDRDRSSNGNGSNKQDSLPQFAFSNWRNL